MVLAVDERETIMGNFSTLEMLDMSIGENTSAKWLVILVNDLNKFSGSKNMDEKQAESLAYLIAQEYKDMKYSVLQLFFYKFKCGYFGKFYGKVDPMSISCALKDFAVDVERQRQQYISEEYEKRQLELDSICQEVYRKWYDLDNAFMLEVNDLDKPILRDVSIEKVYVEDKTILLAVTKQQHEMLEGVYFTIFESLFKKFFPDMNVMYSLYDNRTIDEVVQDAKMKKTFLNHQEPAIALSYARCVVDNSYDLDKAGLALMRMQFEKRYGCSPEVYVRQHAEEKTKS